METVEQDMVMTSFPSTERITATLSGLESRLRLAATGRESYSAVAVVVHQLFDLSDARLGIVAEDGVHADCHTLTGRGVETPPESLRLASTAYGQVVASGCADYEPLSSSLVLPVPVGGATSFLQLVKSGMDSFAFDEFETADKLVAVLIRDLHTFARRGDTAVPATEEQSPLGIKAPDTISGLNWGSDVIAHQ